MYEKYEIDGESNQTVKSKLNLIKGLKDEYDPSIIDELFELKKSKEFELKQCEADLKEIIGGIIVLQNNILRMNSEG